MVEIKESCGSAVSTDSRPRGSARGAALQLSQPLRMRLGMRVESNHAAQSAFVAAFAACVVPVTVYAQDSDDVSQAVVVTASRSEQLLREAIPHTTIITSREIRASGAADLPSLLRKEAGFEFSQSGGIGTVSSTFLRGATTNQTLVLVDGVRLSNLNFGATALDQLMLDQIERVEIVRGNVSSLYGSGAIGGVIQVFTRAGTGAPRASIDLGLGEQGEQRLRAQYAGAVGDTRFSVNLSHFSTDGFSAQKPANSATTNPDRDGYRNLSLSANLEHRFSADHQAGVRYFSSDGKVEFDNAFAASVNDKHTADARVGSWAVFSNNRIAQWWLSKLTYSEGYDLFDSYTNSTVASRAKTKDFAAHLAERNPDRRRSSLHDHRGVAASVDHQQYRLRTLGAQCGRTGWRLPGPLRDAQFPAYSAQRGLLRFRREPHALRRLRLRPERTLAADRGLQHGVPRADLQRTVLSGFGNPNPAGTRAASRRVCSTRRRGAAAARSWHFTPAFTI